MYCDRQFIKRKNEKNEMRNEFVVSESLMLVVNRCINDTSS